MRGGPVFELLVVLLQATDIHTFQRIFNSHLKETAV